jgi:hypothetical protein
MLKEYVTSKVLKLYEYVERMHQYLHTRALEPGLYSHIIFSIRLSTE